MKTKDRILDAALQLFNHEGTAAVSTNHIAEAAGVSPGNLYYHFHNKEEIIRAIFERLNGAWDAAFDLAPDYAPGLADIERMVQANFGLLWQYRFFYRELIALLRRDPLLRERFSAVRQRGLSDFELLVESFSAAGVMAVPDAGTSKQLATLCWLISEFWLPSLELSGQTVDEASLGQGVELLMQVLRPYLRQA